MFGPRRAEGEGNPSMQCSWAFRLGISIRSNLPSLGSFMYLVLDLDFMPFLLLLAVSQSQLSCGRRLQNVQGQPETGRRSKVPTREDPSCLYCIVSLCVRHCCRRPAAVSISNSLDLFWDTVICARGSRTSSDLNFNICT